MVDPRTEDFKGVELAHTGTFNASTGKITFTRQDFDDMVDASQALKGKVDFPLKLGHNESQKLLQEDGLPAAGWIENVRRNGNTLVADFMRVPEKIAEIMKAGGFRKRSIEAMRNVVLAGQRFAFVLTGAALLGEELPAVDSLDDIAALYTAASLDWPDAKKIDADAGAPESVLVIIQAAEHAEDDDEDDVENMIKEIQRIIGRGDSLVKGRKGAPRLRHMLEGAIAEIRRVGRTKASAGEGHDMEITKELKEKLGLAEDATDEQVEAAITDLKAKVDAGDKGGANDGGDDDKGGDSEALKAEVEKREALEAKVLTLENDKAKSTATEAADAAIKASKFAPAVRSSLIQMALDNSKGFEELVKNTPVIAGMAIGVIGSADRNDADADLSEYEPDAEQLKLAIQLGNTKEGFILQAIADAEEIAGKDLVSETVKASLAPKKAD